MQHAARCLIKSRIILSQRIYKLDLVIKTMAQTASTTHLHNIKLSG